MSATSAVRFEKGVLKASVLSHLFGPFEFYSSSNSSSYSNSCSISGWGFIAIESLLYSSSISILISVFTFNAKLAKLADALPDGPGAPLNLPFTFELTLNVGFGMETTCFFIAFGIA